MNSKMEVDELWFIKTNSTERQFRLLLNPRLPHLVLFNTLFLWCSPHALFLVLHLCCGIHKGSDCFISGFSGRSGVVPCWLRSKRHQNAAFVLPKEKDIWKENPSVKAVLVCCVVLCSGIMRGGGIERWKTRYRWLWVS